MDEDRKPKKNGKRWKKEAGKKQLVQKAEIRQKTGMWETK